MSENIKDPGGMPEHAASGGGQESSHHSGGMHDDANKDKVARSTYLKTVSEVKKLREKYEALQQQNERFEQEKLEAEGKKDELISRLRDDLEGQKRANEQFHTQMAYDKVSSQVVNAAVKRGCRDPQSLVRLLDGQFAQMEIGQDFSVNEADMDRLMDDAEKKYQYFFQKAAPSIADGTPATPKVDGGRSLDSLTLDEKLRALAIKSRK